MSSKSLIREGSLEITRDALAAVMEFIPIDKREDVWVAVYDRVLERLQEHEIKANRFFWRIGRPRRN